MNCLWQKWPADKIVPWEGRDNGRGKRRLAVQQILFFFCFVEVEERVVDGGRVFLSRYQERHWRSSGACGFLFWD